MKRSHALEKPVHLSVLPGTKQWVRQSFTAAQGQTFVVSVGMMRGMKPGPTLASVAGQHGMEHTGPVVLRDFFDELDPAAVAGLVMVCPCANPMALAYNFEVFPEREKLPEPGAQDLTWQMFGIRERDDFGEYNMNRCWSDDIAQPASPEAGEGVAARIARWLWQTMIGPADVVVDHHAVKDTRKPYVFCETEAIEWAPWLGLEGIWCTGPLVAAPTPYPYRRLTMQAIRHSKIGLCIEYSRQFTVREEDRPAGRFAMFNLMKVMRMIEGEPVIPRPVWLIPGPYWEHLEELKASATGHLHFSVEDYQWLRRGDRIACIRDLQTNEVLERVVASTDGLMLHRTPRPVIRPGDWVCSVSKDARLLAEPGRPCCLPTLSRRNPK